MDSIGSVPGAGLDIIRRQTPVQPKQEKPLKQEPQPAQDAVQGLKDEAGKVQGTLDVEA